MDTVNLSERYLKKDTLVLERKKLKDAKSNVDTLLMRKSVLVDADEDATTELQQFLNQFSGSLRLLDFSNSNVSGRIFYRGRAKQVKDPVGEHVTVESKGADGEPVVRDDDPELEFIEGDEVYHYVKTMFSPLDKTFSRYYVLLDWLKNVTTVNMSGTSVSGYGLTALVAAAANTLQTLSIKNCSNVDDRGLYAIARLCKSLTFLDISVCPKLTQHGILYLTEMPLAQIKKLKEINIANQALSPAFPSSFFFALEDRSFQGVVYYFHPPNDIKSFMSTGTNPTRFEKYSLAFPHIFDLQLENITSETLKPYESSDSYELDLSDRLINDRVLGLLLKRFGSRLAALKLSGTYITHNGLAHLNYCPNLLSLHVSRCWNIIYKSKANRAIMPALNNMPYIREIYFSDTRLSGRMLSEHPSLKLTSLEADRCPISVHAMRMLAENCEHTLTNLSLAGCNFMNTKAMHYLNKFSVLKTLNLSQCTGLSRDDFKQLTHVSSALKQLHTLDVSGIHGMDKAFCQKLANDLTEKCDGVTVTVINTGKRGSEINHDKNPYLPIPSFHQQTPTTSDEDKQKPSYSPMPGLEPLSGSSLPPGPPSLTRVPSIPTSSGPRFSSPPLSRLMSDRGVSHLRGGLSGGLSGGGGLVGGRLSGGGVGGGGGGMTDDGKGIYKPIPASAILQPRNLRSKTLPLISGSPDLPRHVPLLVVQHSQSLKTFTKENLDSYSPFQASDFGSNTSQFSHFSKSLSFPTTPAPSGSSSSSSSSTSTSTSSEIQNYFAMEPSEIDSQSSRIST